MAVDTSINRSRRAILMGALGGVAAAVATAVGRATPVSAADGDIVHVGQHYSASGTTVIHASGYADGFYGSSQSATGIYGTSDSGIGVSGGSNSGYGVKGYSGDSYGVNGSSGTSAGVYGTGPGSGVNGQSTSGDGVSGSSVSGNGISGSSTSASGVYGSSAATDQAAILGQSYGASTGIQGYSGPHNPPTPPAKTGVYGYANQGATAVGVSGKSPTGRGGQFSGGKAQLRLVPSTATTHPSRGSLGDLFLDKNKRLWFCKGGTTWHQIA